MNLPFLLVVSPVAGPPVAACSLAACPCLADLHGLPVQILRHILAPDRSSHPGRSDSGGLAQRHRDTEEAHAESLANSKCSTSNIFFLFLFRFLFFFSVPLCLCARSSGTLDTLGGTSITSRGACPGPRHMHRSRRNLPVNAPLTPWVARRCRSGGASPAGCPNVTSGQAPLPLSVPLCLCARSS